MAGGQEGFVVDGANFVVEDDFCAGRGAIDDVDSAFRLVTYGAEIAKREFDERNIAAFAGNGHVFQSVTGAEGFAGVLKIERIGAVPHNLHGIDFAKPHIEGMGGAQFGKRGEIGHGQRGKRGKNGLSDFVRRWQFSIRRRRCARRPRAPSHRPASCRARPAQFRCAPPCLRPRAGGVRFATPARRRYSR